MMNSTSRRPASGQDRGSVSPEADLDYQVFTATRPGLTPDLPSGYESLMWVANSATLIYGQRDAVLVDTFLMQDQSVKLAQQIAETGKNLTHIYITHGHGDHFFGINAVKQQFPDARAVATASVTDRIAKTLAPDELEGFWRQRYPGQIPDDPGNAESLNGAPIELEGYPLIPIETGSTDTAGTTGLQAPSIGLIAAGDVVYNGIHPYLAESNRETRREWINALDTLDELDARVVVAGHKIPDHDDDPQNIAATREYLRDFIRLDEETETPRALFDAMMELYRERANPGSLWGGAKIAKTQAAT
jgi:glyoxylase-like metal-dependent hydrolase (beta-lactamase superfamily II)